MKEQLDKYINVQTSKQIIKYITNKRCNNNNFNLISVQNPTTKHCPRLCREATISCIDSIARVIKTVAAVAEGAYEDYHKEAKADD